MFPLDEGEPLRVSAGHSMEGHTRWSPSGEQLAFISDRAGSDQLFLMPARGGAAEQVGSLPGVPSSFEWSPGGDALAVLCAMRVDPDLRGRRASEDAAPPPGAPQVAWKLPYKADGSGYILDREVHLFRVNPADGTSRQLTDGPFDVRSARWSPDGTRIAYTRTREGDSAHRTDLWLVDADGGSHRQLTADLAQTLYPVWSPDGRWIVLSGTVAEGDDQTRLWLFDVAAGRLQGLGGESVEVLNEGHSVRFCDGDSSRVLAVVATRGTQQAAEVAVPSGDLTLLTQGDRHISELSASRDYLVYCSASPVSPMELYCCRRDGSSERQLSRFNAWWNDRSPGVMVRRSFRVPDGNGGTESIDGWLVRGSAAAGPQPLLIDVHGGPASYVLFDFPRIAYWSALWSQGWSILALNTVGSAGYGRDFSDRLRGRWGELDLPQYMAAIDCLREEGTADERVAIIGKSYGGYLSALAIGKTKLFRAAVVMAPVSNIETHFGTSDSGYYSDPYTLYGDRQVNREVMRKLSPTQYAERATTPTLILQGAEDERCPKCQAEELFVSMKRGANPPCELVIYPGASHKFTTEGKPSQRLDAMRRIVQWLTRWIQQPAQAEEQQQQQAEEHCEPARSREAIALARDKVDA
jgi:dipeptidyl aminopeptidase/acylaminoacyl peptidase